MSNKNHKLEAKGMPIALDACYWMLDSGHWMFDTGGWFFRASICSSVQNRELFPPLGAGRRGNLDSAI